MRITTFILIIILSSCKETNPNRIPTNTADNNEMLTSINAFHKSYESAIKENRLDDLDNHYAVDSKVIPPGGDEWDNLLKLAEEREVSVAYDSLFINIEETKILNDSMAYDWGTSMIYFTDRNGQTQKIDDSFLVILIRRNGEWKIYRELSSSVVF